MRMQYFGDSYDIVKKSLIGWLGNSSDWFALPMFTHEVTPDDLTAFESFLDVQVLSSETINKSTDRENYFSVPENVGFLFLDPDTGVKFDPITSRRSPEYVFGPELMRLCEERRDRVLLVFDQSVQRGSEQISIEKKLNLFKKIGIHGFAYLSHACFLILTGTNSVRDEACERLISCSGLPRSRFVQATDA